jgi:hypothetical protein
MLKNLFRKMSTKSTTSTSTALEKFIQSTQIGHKEWHDGIDYDLSMLNELNSEELKQVESLLISRKDQDIRDVKGLATIKTPAAIEALKECLHSKNIDVKLYAARYLKEMNIADRIEEVVIDTLPLTKIGQGMTYVLALAKEYPTELIKQKLLWCSLHGNDDIRLHCAAMTLFLYGKASSEFDKNQKIIYKFGIRDKAKRMEAFPELCQLIGVSPDSFVDQNAG